MANDTIRAKVAELRGHQQDIQAACRAQPDGWRYAVVTGRRRLGAGLGELSDLIAARPAGEGTERLRRAVSSLRAALAEHQARWPAVSLDPGDPGYVTSVTRVRDAYAQLDRVVDDLDTPSPPVA